MTRLQRHIEELAAELGLPIRYGRVDPGQEEVQVFPDLPEFGIDLPEWGEWQESGIGYGIALHELGHGYLKTPYMVPLVEQLDEEIKASVWGYDHLLPVLDADVRARAVVALAHSLGNRIDAWGPDLVYTAAELPSTRELMRRIGRTYDGWLVDEVTRGGGSRAVAQWTAVYDLIHGEEVAA